MIETGFFVPFGIASDIRWSSRHEQSFDILDRGEGAGFGSHPRFLGWGIAFVNQTLHVDLAERHVTVLVDAGDRDGTGGDHRSSRQFALFFEVFHHFIKSRCGNASWHPAIAIVRGATDGSGRATAVPDRNIVLRRRFELDIFEVVVIVFVCDLLPGPEAAAKLGISFRHVGAILQSHLFITSRFEFMGKSTEPETHDEVFAHGAEPGHRLCQMNWVAMRDHCTGAEYQFLAYR